MPSSRKNRALPKKRIGLDTYPMEMCGLRGTHHDKEVLEARGLLTGAVYKNIGGKVVLVEFAYKAEPTTLTGEQLVAWANRQKG